MRDDCFSRSLGTCCFFSLLVYLETTSESGVSDLETSMNDFRCTCCPYGYHLDTDFMKFLDEMYGPDALRTLKRMERKRHDVRRRLIHEQQSSVGKAEERTPIRHRPSSDFDSNEIIYDKLNKIVYAYLRCICHPFSFPLSAPSSKSSCISVISPWSYLRGEGKDVTRSSESID